MQAVPRKDSFIGRTLGDFVIREPLGAGGFGRVFLAEQVGLGREAVVKILHERLLSSETSVQRFLREAKVAAQLDHPYAAHTYAFGAEPDGVLWIAMELVRGTPLDKLLDAQGAIPLERFVPLLECICEVVHTAHERGIVHRDIKPANVMVLSRAGRLLPKLVDFGIAKIADGDDDRRLTPLPVTRRTGEPSAELDAMTPVPGRLRAVRPTDVALGSTMLAPAAESFGDVTLRDEQTDVERTLPPGAGLPASAGLPANRQTAASAGLAASRQAAATSFGQLTRDGATIGSPTYMAPEQWSDSSTVSAASDLYAIGILAFESLTGKPPFTGRSTLELAKAHASLPPPPLGPGFPVELDAVFARALAKSPTDRFASALDLGAAFRAASGVVAGTVALPELDAALRTRIVSTAPQPLAMAVARLEAARNPHQARDAIWQITRVAARLVGLVALSSHAHIDVSRTDPAIGEALGRLRGELDDRDWLDIARVLVTPFADRRDAHPVPELCEYLLRDRSLDELLALRAASERAGGGADLQVRELVEHAVTLLGRALTDLEFLSTYPLVVAGERGAEAWMGLPFEFRRVIDGAAALKPGRPTMVDAHGAAVVELWPLVQAAAPVPGSPVTLFLFDGRGRRGARLVALPEAFEHEDEQLWDSFGLLGTTAQDAHDDAETAQAAPYRGLVAFGQGDAQSFFGRERESAACVNRLRMQSFLAVVGPSGAGKSSFVAAGLVPALPSSWRSMTVRPGPAPFGALAARLAASGARGVQARDLEDQPELLGQLLRTAVARRNETIVLIVDQLEELFTLCDDEATRQRFAAALSLAARSPDDPLRVIVTLRDDFLLRAEALPEFRARLGQSLQLLTTPARPDLLRILTEPLRRIGYQFEDPELPAEMVDAVADTPGALALLSFSASRLWELRDRRFHHLSRKAYDSLGGVGGALAQHAEATLAALPVDEQRLVREIFRHAVTAEGTRASMSRAELGEVLGGGPRAGAVIEKLVGARLLSVAEREDGGEQVEIAHEALLTAWPRLVGWRREDGEGARLRDQVRSAARQWEDRGRASGLLWRGDALAEYQIWRGRFPGALSASEEAFAGASVAEASRGRRARTALVATAFVALLAVVVALLVLNARVTGERAEAQRARAEAESAAGRAHDLLLSQYESQARRLILADDPLQALAYLTEAARLGAHGAAHDLLVGQALRASDGEEHRLRHESMVLRVRFSPDGTRLVSASYDKTARLWDTRTGTLIAKLSHDGPVFLAEFRPDGRQVITSSDDGTIGLWDAETGANVARFSSGQGRIGAAVFSPDGKLIASVGLDESVRLWRADGTRIRELQPALELAVAAKAPAFSPDSRWLAVGDLGGVIRVWDTHTGKRVATLTGHTDAITWLQFSPDGQRLVSASNDRSAAVWDVAGKVRLTQIRHGEPVTYASFDPGGTRIATASADRTAAIWHAGTGELKLSLTGHIAGVRRAVFSHDGARIATVSDDTTAMVWDTATGQRVSRLLGHLGGVYDVAFSPDDRRLATAGGDNHAILWDAAPQASMVRLEVGAPSRWAAFSPDGTIIATASADGQSRLWDSKTGRRLAVLRGHVGKVQALRFSADGSLIATSGDDGTVRLFDGRTGKPGRVMHGHTNFVEYLAWHADGRRLASASADGILRVWDVTTGKTLWSTQAHGGREVFAVGFAAGGKVLVSHGEDGFTRLWDADTGKPRQSYPAPALPFTLSFDRSGRRVASCDIDQQVALWSLDDGQTSTRLIGHSGNLLAAEWSPDDELLVSSATDGTARVWDAAHGDLLLRLDHGATEVWAASFSPDGRRILTASNNGSATIWDVPRFTGTPAELDRIIRCRVPYKVEGDRLVPRQRDVAACDQVRR